jgi:hypothetical protein
MVWDEGSGSGVWTMVWVGGLVEGLGRWSGTRVRAMVWDEWLGRWSGSRVRSRVWTRVWVDGLGEGLDEGLGRGCGRGSGTRVWDEGLG